MGAIKNMMIDVQNLLDEGWNVEQVATMAGCPRDFVLGCLREMESCTEAQGEAYSDYMEQDADESADRNWAYDHLERDHDEPYEGDE